ncbi:MAG TPA: nuclear transport factor 2 family protein [Novosphingobium sp.]
MRFTHLILLAAVAGTPAIAKEQTRHMTTTSADQAAIEQGVQTYLHSIDAADTAQGATIFLNSPETFFIHPRGTERGWDDIAKDFYGQTMGESFTKRSLRLVSPARIHLYDRAAVVEFEWDFHAVRRDNGQPLHTEGRESQTWIKTAQGWRIAHVHYSGLPVTGVGQGF